MTEMVPDNTNRIAYIIGLIFHPAVLAIVTLILILKDLSISEVLIWTASIAFIILTPGFIAIAYLKRQQRYTYQTKTREPLFIVAWLSVIACLIVIQVFNGPPVLTLCMATLAVWLPLQLTINRYVTKISVHSAVSSGCFTALLLLDKLGTALIISGVIIIILVAWSRLTTKNHTLLQIVLGIIVGIGSVLLVFSLLLNDINLL